MSNKLSSSVFDIALFLQQTHPVRVLLAVHRALPAADIVLVGHVSLDRHDPEHQLLLYLFHLLLLCLLRLHLVHQF